MPEIAEPTTRYEVRYRAIPAWEVGERTPEHMPGEHYPDDYAGKMIDMREVDSDLPSLRHMEDKTRPVIELDLTAPERSTLCNRTAKITSGKLASVTFGDRWGAVAEPLRARFVDAEIAERKLELDSPDAEAEEFGRVSCALMRALPAPDVHTGTGNYYTKKVPAHLDRTQSGAPAGQVITLTVGGLGTADAYIGGYVTNATRAETRAIVSHTDDTTTLEGNLANWLDTDDLDVYDAWSTVQGHQDQLWADQSTAWFTAPQLMRTYAGTYDENVVVNVGLNFRWQYPLIIEGDPADDRDNIVIAPAAGTYGLLFASTGGERIIVRHMKFAGSPTITLVALTCSRKEVEDCVFVANGVECFRPDRNQVRVVDCDFTQQGAAGAIAPNLSNTHIYVENCKFTGAGSSTAIVTAYAPYVLVRGCRISGFAVGIGGSYGEGIRDIRNCTIYNCTYAFSGGGAYSATLRIELYNNIVHTVSYVWYDTGTHPPEETSTYVGPRVLMRNNCFYNYTTAFWRQGTSHTYAQTIAMNRVDAAGDLDATDPLLTNPGAGDFSLAADSPCKRTGAGSGVPTDVDGVAYDMQNPDMGAVSSGSGTSAPSTGIITTVPGTVTVPVTLGGAPYVRARLLDVDYVQEDEQTEASEGAGTIALTAASAGWKYVAIWGVSAGDDPIGEPGSVERIWVPPAAVTVYYSIDGGTTWVAADGDAWPVTAGEHIVRLHVRDAELSRRIMVKIESTDADTWGVRRITVKGNRKLQEMSLE